MSAVRKLDFQTEDQVVAEVERLRKGYRKKGNWTMSQICWHIGLAIDKYLAPPVPMDLQRTPDQEAIKVAFVDYIIAEKAPPPSASKAPDAFVPPANLTIAEIDRYIALLMKMKTYPHPKVMMGPIGPVTIEEFRLCNIFHAAHHLAFLEPIIPTRRKALKYVSLDELIADIQSLRKGYTQAGNWNLNQMAWHLNAAMTYLMSPGPHPEPAPLSEEKQAVFNRVIETGEIPSGIEAPAAVVPPLDAGEQAIDQLLATIEKAKTFPGPFAPHRIFGKISDSQMRQMILIHSAHHLSYLQSTES